MAYVVILAAAVRFALLIKLHLMPSGYHPVRHAVSDYAVGPTARIARYMAAPAVVGWWAFAALAYGVFPLGFGQTLVIACCLVAGLCVVAMQWAPTDLEGTKLTPLGIMHYALAIIQFACAYTAMGPVADLLASPVLSWLQVATRISLIGVCLTVAGPGRRVFGLVERAFLLFVLCFYTYAAGVVAWG